MLDGQVFYIRMQCDILCRCKECQYRSSLLLSRLVGALEYSQHNLVQSVESVTLKLCSLALIIDWTSSAEGRSLVSAHDVSVCTSCCNRHGSVQITAAPWVL